MTDPTDLGERAITAAQNILKKGQEVAVREARVVRLQGQISRMRANRQRLLAQMGEKVYELFTRDLVKNQDLRLFCQQVKGLDAEIAVRREEIEQLRAGKEEGEGGIDADPTDPTPDDDEAI